MPIIIQKTTAPQNAEATYKSLLKARIVGRTIASVVIQNTDGSAAVNWKVLVSNDTSGAAGSWGTLKAEASLAASTTTPYAITGAFGWIDVQIDSINSGESPACNCWILATGV